MNVHQINENIAAPVKGTKGKKETISKA